MKLLVPTETHPGENRAAITPEITGKLVKLGVEVVVESGLGAGIHVDNGDYVTAGATLVSGPELGAALAEADMVWRVRKPDAESIARSKKGSVHIGFLDPFHHPELVAQFAKAELTAISVEMIPRSTIAQKMDALSSQANLAGYVSVVLAADRLDRVFPMMMTPSGTISPARVFVIGVGVAGLQAIATARRLGARVDAFDTRPVVEEQVKSLGAKFVKIDLGETGQTEQGYAKELTPEQIERQRQGMLKQCAASDVVITTAQVFGRPAPVLVTADMLRAMQVGSVVVDLAVETGGNVEGSRPGEEVVIGGVKVVGLVNLPGRVAVHASQMYANNLYNFVTHFWDKAAGDFQLNWEDDIIKGAVLTHGGEIVHPKLKTGS